MDKISIVEIAFDVLTPVPSKDENEDGYSVGITINPIFEHLNKVNQQAIIAELKKRCTKH